MLHVYRFQFIMIKILAACGAGVNSSHQIKSALEEEFFRHELDREQMYEGIEKLFNRAGDRLTSMGKIVVPNFPARDGNWRGQGRFGGVFESNWLGWGGAGDGWLSADECVEQARRLNEAEGQIILRAPGANRNYIRHLGLALAAAWVVLPEPWCPRRRMNFCMVGVP